MARVTIDDCLEHVDNRFSLIHLASERARQLKEGAKPLVAKKNKDIVLALREIAEGLITYDNIKNFEPANAPDDLEVTYSTPEGYSGGGGGED
ncbi:MAG: DNA-directed RNA polymerase subunit omega [Deltaproteobacteria bacterium]|jgi:DNA-directed RNA polymerase subunit omega|nr:DNA-directed RNA polymerase subunit omega [Deltaproteobacteria bacterium]